MRLSTIGNNYRRVTLTLVLFAVAAIMIAIGVFISMDALKGYNETTATITNIVETGSGDDVTHQVYVNYTVDGVEYTNKEIDAYDSSYAVGKQITILYDPNDPGTIIGKQPLWLFILLFGGGALCLAGGVASIVFALRSMKKARQLSKEPDINDAGREIKEVRKMYFALDRNTHVKLRFTIENEDRQLLYEGKMIKHSLFGPHTYLFSDYVRNQEKEHKVGHVNSAETDSFTVSAGFKFDGVEMTEYLDANRIEVKYGVGTKGVAMACDIFYKGNFIAHAESSSPYVHEEDAAEHKVASAFRLNSYFFQIEGQEDYVDVIFLSLFREAISPRLSSLMG